MSPITVKIGNHNIVSDITDMPLSMSCEDFIQSLFDKLHIKSRQTSMYKLFEMINGIERCLNSDEIIHKTYSSVWRHDTKIELVVRKQDKQVHQVKQFKSTTIKKFYDKINTEQKKHKEMQIEKDKFDSHVDCLQFIYTKLKEENMNLIGNRLNSLNANETHYLSFNSYGSSSGSSDEYSSNF